MKNKSESVYERNGYKSRADYLKTMSLEYGVDYASVCMMAEVLGPNEDFDGLISSLDDYLGFFPYYEDYEVEFEA